ncbi:MAG TPA: hypothetical protein VFJ16_23820 [Longimicrobium sp.]|nr:hypothetical protein [Longimicrobium sp.]
MITREEAGRLMERPAAPVPVLSLYLDVRVGGDNRRTHEVWLAGQRRRADELAAAHPGLDAAAAGAVLDRAAGWVEQNLDPASEGVACFAEVGGDWFEAWQVPIPLPNRLALGAGPAVAPLLNALQGRRRHAVALVDRSRLRLLSVWLATVMEEREIRAELYPAAHDVQSGGAAAHRYQQAKLEEERQNFARFAHAAARFVERTGADDVVLLGTGSNVARLRRALPAEIAGMVAHTASIPADAPTAEVLARLASTLDAAAEREGHELVGRLRERMATGYLAAAGVQRTLSALQNGKVEAALLPDGGDATGARCARCGFLFSGTPDVCPFDGAPVERGVPVVEEAIRLAASQGARIRLVPPGEAAEFAGAGALLRF